MDHKEGNRVAYVYKEGRTMNTKAVSGMTLTLLFICALTLAFMVQSVIASGTLSEGTSMQNNQNITFIIVAASEGQVGVEAGDWIKYDYTVSGALSGTPLPAWMKVEFLSVEVANATSLGQWRLWVILAVYVGMAVLIGAVYFSKKRKPLTPKLMPKPTAPAPTAPRTPSITPAPPTEARVREAFIKRYFRVILKPVTLTILFFAMVVWVYFASSPAILDAVSFRLRPEQVAQEIARLSSLQSFLAGVFRGDFGCSFLSRAPVSLELHARLMNTGILMVLYVVISILTGLALSWIALVLKSKRRKPLTFAYSLKGFLFGLAPLISIVLLFVLSFQLGLLPGAGSLPPEWTLEWPENVFVYITGRLRYLVLPMLTLTVICLVRNLIIVWSVGSPFTSRKVLKRFLLPFTTIDFAFMISAVLLIEPIFTYPGLGQWIYGALAFADYNVAVGSFIVLLALAVLLGGVSVLLDFFQHLSGLQKDLEKKATRESEPRGNLNRPQKKSIITTLRRPSFVAGLVIVSLFGIVAVFAPLLTPHDPVYGEYVAADYATPAWLTSLPGGANLSENLLSPTDPGFPTAVSLTEWNFTTTGNTALNYDEFMGSPLSGPGCAAVMFRREAGEPFAGAVTAHLTKVFYYPYEGPPRSFRCKIGLLITDVEDLTDISVTIFIRRMKGNGGAYVLWEDSYYTSSSTWTMPTDIDSYSKGVPAESIFKETGSYALDIMMVFTDQRPGTLGRPVEATVYIDDFSIELLGSCYGLLGTDHLGRDVFSQVLYGARTMAIMTLPIALLAVFAGWVLGFFAGFVQNWADKLVVIFVDTLFTVPIFPFFIIVLMITGPLEWWWAQPPFSWFFFALATLGFRNTYLLRSKDQKLPGITPLGQFFNLLRDFCASLCFMIASLMLLLPTISLFGLFNPAVASWGRMLYDARWNMAIGHAWWCFGPPVFCICFFALGFFLIGMALDERF